jgi:hypothetical protein
MNWEQFGRKWLWSNGGIILEFAWKDQGKLRKTSE